MKPISPAPLPDADRDERLRAPVLLCLGFTLGFAACYLLMNPGGDNAPSTTSSAAMVTPFVLTNGIGEWPPAESSYPFTPLVPPFQLEDPRDFITPGDWKSQGELDLYESYEQKLRRGGIIPEVFERNYRIIPTPKSSIETRP